jgi:hypothetical protein
MSLKKTREWLSSRVSTEVTFWHSAEYGSDFRCNSGEIPRNSAEFRGISPELRRNHFRSQKIPRNSVSAEFRGHPTFKTFPLQHSSLPEKLVGTVSQDSLNILISFPIGPYLTIPPPSSILPCAVKSSFKQVYRSLI